MTHENSLGPCERFTVLASRTNQTLSQCDVCDHIESSHENPGRRILSGGEIEELRRRILVATFEKREEERGRGGKSTA